MQIPRIKTERTGGNGRVALYNFEVLPENVKNAIKSRYPNGMHQAASVNYLEKFYEYDTMAYDFYLSQGLTDKQIKQYTANASVVQAVIKCLNDRTAYQNALGAVGRRKMNYEQIMDDLTAKRTQWGHSYKSERTLRRAVNAYKEDGYESLISKKIANQNAAKVQEPLQQATLRRLMGDFRNLDNQQVADMYHVVCKEEITAQTVANYREKWQLYADAGSRGEKHYDNFNGLQVKRKRPTFAGAMWVLDGWDVELYYQQTTTDKEGRSRTTYTNRLTLELVIDPCNGYPLGYTIADHESAVLIKSALRNAVRHTKEIFGCYVRPHQLQMDNFAKKETLPFYEAMAKYVIPAKVGNAKSKVIEPFFKRLNKLCQFQPNWSGFGLTSRAENQPNAEFMNKTVVKKNFPDREGVIRQIETIINSLRADLIEEYRELWAAAPDDKKLIWNTEQFLHHAGETTKYTNRLEGQGLRVTLGGVKRTYDSFDMDFRFKYRNEDWQVKYDPIDTSMILVEGDEGRARFLLEEKYEQPMALVEREEGDYEQLQKIYDYNKAAKEHVIAVSAADFELIHEAAQSQKEFEVLSKFLITDSRGQHKLNKANARLLSQGAEPKEAKEDEEQDRSMIKKRLAYIDEKHGDIIAQMIANS